MFLDGERTGVKLETEDLDIGEQAGPGATKRKISNCATIYEHMLASHEQRLGHYLTPVTETEG